MASGSMRRRPGDAHCQYRDGRSRQRRPRRSPSCRRWLAETSPVGPSRLRTIVAAADARHRVRRGVAAQSGPSIAGTSQRPRSERSVRTRLWPVAGHTQCTGSWVIADLGSGARRWPRHASTRPVEAAGQRRYVQSQTSRDLTDLTHGQSESRDGHRRAARQSAATRCVVHGDAARSIVGMQGRHGQAEVWHLATRPRTGAHAPATRHDSRAPAMLGSTSSTWSERPARCTSVNRPGTGPATLSARRTAIRSEDASAASPWLAAVPAPATRERRGTSRRLDTASTASLVPHDSRLPRAPALIAWTCGEPRRSRRWATGEPVEASGSPAAIRARCSQRHTLGAIHESRRRPTARYAPRTRGWGLVAGRSVTLTRPCDRRDSHRADA